MTDVAAPAAGLVEGRSCDGCTLCCKLLRVPTLDKPRLSWCAHCDIGVGCRIYGERPRECAGFYCTYRWSPELGEEWKPSKCGMVLNYERSLQRLNISVDPDRGEVWREEPYHSQIRAMALHLLRRRGHVLVWRGHEAIVILPHKEVPLGVSPDRRFSVCGRETPQGEEYEVILDTPPDGAAGGPG